MKTTAVQAAANRGTARAPTRGLTLLAAAMALLVAMLGHALTAPPTADAVPMTDADYTYISLLADAGIRPAPGYSYVDLAQGGRTIARSVVLGVPVDALVDDIYYNSNLTYYQARWQVAAAVAAYAPWLLDDGGGGTAL